MVSSASIYNKAKLLHLFYFYSLSFFFFFLLLLLSLFACFAPKNCCRAPAAAPLRAVLGVQRTKIPSLQRGRLVYMGEPRGEGRYKRKNG